MSKKEEVHVVMLPWLAFGHMIPYLDLSIALAKFGIHVSFLSTPRNIQRLPKIPPEVSARIDFVPLPLPKLDADPLPENAEATVDIPADKMDQLKIACDLLHEPIRNFVAEKLPNWMIVDFFPHWAVDIAQDLSIPLIPFFATSGSTIVFFWAPEFLPGDERRRQARPSPQHLTMPPAWVDFPSKVACRKHEAGPMHNGIYGVNASGVADGARYTRIVQASRAIALRTCLELEADYLKLASEITGKPVIPVGFLPPEKLEQRRITREEPWSKIFDWLDQQRPSSVVFVGFGSEYKLKKDEIHEIAHGIELSGLPFLFALRKPDWASDGFEALPPGFASRTAGRGVVQIGWAPQREILAHPSVGGSLFHAGWASVLETMVYGHRLILLPFIIAQPLDTRLLVEKGLAIEVERAEDGSFTRNDIANALQKAMASEEGEALRARTKEAADGIFGNKELHDNYVKKFAEYLKNGIQEKK